MHLTLEAFLHATNYVPRHSKIIDSSAMELTARRRRLLCLLSLLMVIMIPAALKVFFVPDTSQVSSFFLDNRLLSLEADDLLAVGGETILESFLCKGTVEEKQCQRDIHDHLTRSNAGHLELNPKVLSETFGLENNRKQSIHAIVTAITMFSVPLMAFIYALFFLRKPQGSDLSAKKRLGRKERILRDLVECRIQLPTSHKADYTTTGNHDELQECPICLSSFSEGEVVIVPKHCHCSLIRISATANRRTLNETGIASVADAHDTQPKYRQTCCFHENCIFVWLSQRKTNPKKLCPCCRQPFLAPT